MAIQKKINWQVKYRIIERMLINQMRWNYTNTCLKEGEKMARNIIRMQVKDSMRLFIKMAELPKHRTVIE